MIEWLLAPIDISRGHDVSLEYALHARIMFVAWGVIVPLIIFITRYFKILPTQDFPNQIDSQFWWRIHWIGQSCVLILSLIALAIILSVNDGRFGITIHQYFGYVVITCSVSQALSGILRGTKGGPTEPTPDGNWFGDHYSMTKRRIIFEYLHRIMGYVTLICAATAIINGLWLLNAPKWMWITIISWWCIIIALCIICQRRKMYMGSYEAIWGHSFKELEEKYKAK